ncbi:hypothetical protein [Sphingobium sp. MI1205]|uniref:hypothetical protein n=1 Tax=Sphingobium sp. MI1205 TaxID=407020 RepID=UPI0007705E85|nr:hypothetical protein [Sphingobium sp. MI1205]AMK18718.1 hypothetical protein K663_11695 [Sphingobium sp. MI1205]
MVFKKAKDRLGDFVIDWSKIEEGVDVLPSSIEFIPFHNGDARVMSIPAEEVMYCATGKDDRLTHALIALRIGTQSVHHAMSVPLLRQLAENLVRTADLIEAQARS